MCSTAAEPTESRKIVLYGNSSLSFKVLVDDLKKDGYEVEVASLSYRQPYVDLGSISFYGIDSIRCHLLDELMRRDGDYY
jgi:aryl carrier-like protein